MPAAKKQRLKTYQTRIGLHTWVVAAPNQKAALQAWDVHTNLFAKGDAAVTNNPAAIKAALLAPGKPVALELDAKTKLELKGIGNAIPKLQPQDHTRSRPKPKVKPDRMKLDAAEKQTAAFHAKAERARASLERKRKNLLASLEAEEERLNAQESRQKSKLSLAQRDFETRNR